MLEVVMSNSDISSIIDNAEEPAETLEQVLERFSKLPKLEYEMQRKKIAEEHNIRVSVLDEEIEKLRPKENDESESIFLKEIEPWDIA